MRACGLLLHPTSLPTGELGAAAHRFVDFLGAAGQRFWQMLPVGPTGYGDSPYSALSAFAGNPALVSRDRLVEEGLLPDEAAKAPRQAWLRVAHERFRLRGRRAELTSFCESEHDWLEDYALYQAIKRAHGEVQWTRWPALLRDRNPHAIASARKELADEIEQVRFEQYRFHLDWQELRRTCAAARVRLIGDVPIFVAHDSADVWTHRELFRLHDDGEPEVVAGVPPDYFSTTGQRWGNPLYRWRRMRRDGYAWWVARFRAALTRFDAVRLDHFIGFARYWEIPADEPTAVRGRWMKGPGAHFFGVVRNALGELPFIAEDLGAVTPAVTRLRRRFHFPGTRILQFAFGTDPQATLFKPHNYEHAVVAYTGTHDNDTTVGWFRNSSTNSERRAALHYLASQEEIHWAMIRAVYQSVAELVVVPVQDILGLGSEARMNRPGVPLGNWTWRMAEGALTPDLADRLRALSATYERLPTAPEPLPAHAELFS